MSQFSKKPYIEAVLSELSGENKIKLLNFVNGLNADGTSDISYVSCTTISALRSQSSGITPVDYLYSSRIHWKGYLIKTTNFTVFITFKNAIDLNMADVYEVLTNGLNLKESIMSDYLRALLSENEYIDNSELIASLATKADKVTLDSIEVSYDEDTGVSTIIFPPYIMPLYFYCTELEMITEDSCIFFDYTNEEVRDNYNQTISGLEVNENKQVKVDIEGEIPQITDGRLNYMMMDTEDNHVANINTYYLYNQEPSGTKLYKHTISGLTGWNKDWFNDSSVVTIVSTSATPITRNEVEANSCASFTPSATNLQISLDDANVVCSWGNTTYYAFYCLYHGNSISNISCDAGDFTDTVTEL